MKSAVTACVLIIGNEILSGRTQDINLNHIAKTLGKWGIQIRHCRVIPDVEKTIIDTVNEVRQEYDYVFTTGGIGPTHDDITAVCIAKAFGVELIEHPDIAVRIRKRPAPADIMASRLADGPGASGRNVNRQSVRRPTRVCYAKCPCYGRHSFGDAGHACKPRRNAEKRSNHSQPYRSRLSPARAQSLMP